MTTITQSFLRTAFVVVISLPLLLPGGVRAEDWPQWRGPRRDGSCHELGLMETFAKEGLKARWRVPVGPGWSSPIVADGRVFVTDSQLNKPNAKERVLCFDEASGKPLWSYVCDVSYPEWVFTPGQEAGPSATPICEASKVYALGGNGHVLCLDARKGELLWEKRLEKEYQVEELKCRASPLIDGDLLVVFVGGKPGACLVALDKNTGKEVWKALDESVSNSSPIIVTAGGKRQLIVWTGESVTSLEPATGKVWWRERLLTSNNDAISTPVCEKDLLLIGGLMLKLDANKPAAKILWPERRGVSDRVLSNTSTPVLQGDYVFSAKSSGHFVCLEAATGREVWVTDKVTDLKNGASVHVTPHGEAAFLYTDKGELIRAKLTAKGYEEVGRVALLEPVYPFAGRKVTWSPPAFANRHVFARNEKELVCASLAIK